MNFALSTTSFTIDVSRKKHLESISTAVMMLYLGSTKQKVEYFDVQWFLKISKFTCISSDCHLPATYLPLAIRPGSATCTGPIFLTMNVIGVYNTNLLFQKRFIHCAMVIPFILHWPSLFFSKMSTSRKKVLITPGLYFPNYCITYLSSDISHDFKKCEHMNLRREWTHAVFEELLSSLESVRIYCQQSLAFINAVYAYCVHLC